MVGSSLLCMPTQSIVCSSRDSDTCTLDNSILSISHLASLHEPSSSLLFKTARNLGPLRLRSADPGHDLHIFDTCDRHTVSKKARRKTHEHTTERHMRHTPSGNQTQHGGGVRWRTARPKKQDTQFLARLRSKWWACRYHQGKNDDSFFDPYLVAIRRLWPK